jgi:trehalose-6-phosphate synthase
LRNTFKGITLVVGRFTSFVTVTLMPMPLYSLPSFSFFRDVLDVTKGIPEKLLAFEQFLTQYPEWQGKIVLIQNCVKMFHRKSNSKDDAEDDPLQKTINEYF